MSTRKNALPSICAGVLRTEHKDKGGMHALGEVGAKGGEADIAMAGNVSLNLNIFLPLLVQAFLKLWKFWFQMIFGGFNGTPFS